MVSFLCEVSGELCVERQSGGVWRRPDVQATEPQWPMSLPGCACPSVALSVVCGFAFSGAAAVLSVWKRSLLGPTGAQHPGCLQERVELSLALRRVDRML